MDLNPSTASFGTLIGLKRAIDHKRKKGPVAGTLLFTMEPTSGFAYASGIRRHAAGYGQATGLPASRLATSSVRIPVSPKCKKGPVAGTLLVSMEPTSGFEPLTYALRVRCSTS